MIIYTNYYSNVTCLGYQVHSLKYCVWIQFWGNLMKHSATFYSIIFIYLEVNILLHMTADSYTGNLLPPWPAATLKAKDFVSQLLALRELGFDMNNFCQSQRVLFISHERFHVFVSAFLTCWNDVTAAIRILANQTVVTDVGLFSYVSRPLSVTTPTQSPWSRGAEV